VTRWGSKLSDSPWGRGSTRWSLISSTNGLLLRQLLWTGWFLHSCFSRLLIVNIQYQLKCSILSNFTRLVARNRFYDIYVAERKWDKYTGCAHSSPWASSSSSNALSDRLKRTIHGHFWRAAIIEKCSCEWPNRRLFADRTNKLCAEIKREKNEAKPRRNEMSHKPYK